jgi:hypothetical protein
MKKLTLIIVATCFALFANAQKKHTGETKTPETKTAETMVKYKVVVSFTSIGSGIDAKKHDEIEAFIKNNKKKPAYDVIKMGREGERDFCLHLKELTKDEQTSFIAELKKLAEGSDRVKVTENVERVKKQ